MNIDSIRHAMADFEAQAVTAELPQAAVLIAISEDPDPALVMTLRAGHMRTHSGECAFPGGMQDEGETLQTTALRETEEEVGIGRDKVQILGSINQWISRFDVKITPFVGVLERRHPLQIERCELSDAFYLPLAHVGEQRHLRANVFPRRGVNYRVPSFQYGEYEVWGVTGLILYHFMVDVCGAELDIQSAPVFER